MEALQDGSAVLSVLETVCVVAAGTAQCQTVETLASAPAAPAV